MQTSLCILGISAALVMCVVSAAMNYLFLSSLGKTPVEGHVLGAASASADVLKALLPFYIAWSWQARRLIAVASGLSVFIFFAGFSLLSAFGFAAENRGSLVQGRDDLSVAYKRVQDMRSYAAAQRKALPAHRAGEVVVQEIERHRQNRSWASTKRCTDATENKSRDYCAAYFKLKSELAASKEAARLEKKVSDLDTEAARLRADGAGEDSDPQVSVLSRLTGTDQEAVRLALIITVALLVELGASLGLFLASGHGRTGKGSPNTEKTPPPVGSVEDFCLEILEPSNGALSTEAVSAAYICWCRERGCRPLPSGAFEATFQELALQAGVESRADSFQGIGMAAIAFRKAA